MNLIYLKKIYNHTNSKYNYIFQDKDNNTLKGECIKEFKFINALNTNVNSNYTVNFFQNMYKFFQQSNEPLNNFLNSLEKNIGETGNINPELLNNKFNSKELGSMLTKNKDKTLKNELPLLHDLIIDLPYTFKVENNIFYYSEDFLSSETIELQGNIDSIVSYMIEEGYIDQSDIIPDDFTTNDTLEIICNENINVKKLYEKKNNVELKSNDKTMSKSFQKNNTIFSNEIYNELINDNPDVRLPTVLLSNEKQFIIDLYNNYGDLEESSFVYDKIKNDNTIKFHSNDFFKESFNINLLKLLSNSVDILDPNVQKQYEELKNIEGYGEYIKSQEEKYEKLEVNINKENKQKINNY